MTLDMKETDHQKSSSPQTYEEQEVTFTFESFELDLDNFSGPFDVLLSLISRREMSITEVALAKITDEFIAYIKEMQKQLDFLSETYSYAERNSLHEKILEKESEFLVIASILIELKAAKLLPEGSAEADEDFEYLEARDLLFARVLQYKAFKEATIFVQNFFIEHEKYIPRQGQISEEVANFLPPLQWTVTADKFADIATHVFSQEQQKTVIDVDITHLHHATVSLKEQEHLVESKLQKNKVMTFDELIADSSHTLVSVARFMILLDLYRGSAVDFEQQVPLEKLIIMWEKGQEVPEEIY